MSDYRITLTLPLATNIDVDELVNLGYHVFDGPRGADDCYFCYSCHRRLPAEEFSSRCEIGRSAGAIMREDFPSRYYDGRILMDDCKECVLFLTESGIKTQYIREHKNRPCVDCEQTYPSCVMEFDHVRGEKLFALSAPPPKCSLSAIQAEINKCEVVCANCHRIRTQNRR